jgi:ribosomal protein S21
MKGGPVVVLERGVPLEKALKELRRRLDHAGVPSALRRHQWAETPGERRRAKARRAAHRAEKRARRAAEGT